jgi:hypothetical protein
MRHAIDANSLLQQSFSSQLLYLLFGYLLMLGSGSVIGTVITGAQPLSSTVLYYVINLSFFQSFL